MGVASGAPMLSTRTVTERSIVAPWPTHFVGSTAPRSSDDSVPTSVACFDCGGVYEAERSIAVDTTHAVAVAVTCVDATPDSSLCISQLELPAH